MNRNVLIFSLCIILIFSLISISTFFMDSNKINRVILDKDMATKIGRIILEKHFPDAFLNKEYVLESNYDKGIWTIYNVVDSRKKLENGKVMLTMGGGYYVELREDTGEVIKIGVND